jgi:drug/metabolite transporter (DMT)-like permease
VTTIAAPVRQRTAAEIGMLAGVVSVVMWGIGPLFVKGAGVSAPTMVMFRFLLACPVMIGVAYLLGGKLDKPLMRQTFPPGALFGVSMIVGFSAVTHTSVSNASLINNMLPVVVVVYARFVLREHIGGGQYAAVMVAVVGVAVVVFGAGTSGDAALKGDALAFLNLLMWTTFFLTMKRMRDRGTHAWSLLAGVTANATLVAVPICLLISNDLNEVDAQAWWCILGMVFLPGLIGHGLMTWASRHLRVTVSSLLTLASPVVSAVGAWIWLGESMTAWQVLGSAVVLAAVGAIAAGARIDAVREAALSDPPE